MTPNAAYYLAGVATMLAISCGGGGGDAEPAAPCRAPVVQAFGDSTQLGQGGNLQAFMDRRFGAGRVVVENLGVGSTTAGQAQIHLIKPGAVVLANYGINDAFLGVTAEQFRADMRRISPTLVVTPNPPLDNLAQASRAVAAELGRPVADVSAYVRARPDWTSRMQDEVHPNAGLYAEITERVVGPAVAQIVAPLVCKE